MIEAWPELKALAGEPAMTIVPSFLVSGVLTIIFGLLVAICAAKFVQRKNGGLVLILLSIIMLLVGGGLFPPLFGVAAGIIGTRIKHGSESTKHGGIDS
jgi:large exoprotein involved in heme utilization and adhesion